MRKNREYSPEFRAAAVEMVRTSGESIRQVALNLGISNQILGDWLRHFEAADSRPLDAAERQELLELRRRVHTLEAELDILVEACTPWPRGIPCADPDGPADSAPMDSPADLRLVPLSSMDDEHDAWSRLAEGSGNIFSTWEWADAWWRAAGDGKRLALVACRDPNGETVAILPFVLERLGPARMVRWLGHGRRSSSGPSAIPRIGSLSQGRSVAHSVRVFPATTSSCARRCLLRTAGPGCSAVPFSWRSRIQRCASKPLTGSPSWRRAALTSGSRFAVANAISGGATRSSFASATTENGCRTI
jgi:transposase